MLFMVNKLNNVCFVKQFKIKYKIMIYTPAIQTINFTSKKVSLIAQNSNKIKFQLTLTRKEEQIVSLLNKIKLKSFDISQYIPLIRFIFHSEK